MFNGMVKGMLRKVRSQGAPADILDTIYTLGRSHCEFHLFCMSLLLRLFHKKSNLQGVRKHIMDRWLNIDCLFIHGTLV
jgi:hypothetical protein